MIETYLGALAATNLKDTIKFREGGATYEGTLTQVQHDDYGTQIVLRNGEWRHIKTHPSDTPCEVIVNLEEEK